MITHYLTGKQPSSSVVRILSLKNNCSYFPATLDYPPCLIHLDLLNPVYPFANVYLRGDTPFSISHPGLLLLSRTHSQPSL